MRTVKIILSTLFILFLSFFNAYSQAIYNGSDKHRFTTTYGDIGIDPFNTSWVHIYTDRPKIIFNKDVYTTPNAFSSYNNDLVLKTAARERFRINRSNGNVGIGTTTPDAKLAVKGNIHAKEVKVDLVGWPDYVFKENYSLNEVQNI